MRRQKGLDEGQAPTGGVDGGKSVMARMYFGTDGIRGSANSHPMTSVVALKVGMAAGKLFTNGSYRHRVVIGKDTRLSGYMIESALVSGFTAGISGGDQPKSREPGSLAVAISAASQGIQILRVHDVAGSRQGLAVWRAATFGTEN